LRVEQNKTQEGGNYYKNHLTEAVLSLELCMKYSRNFNIERLTKNIENIENDILAIIENLDVPKINHQ